LVIESVLELLKEKFSIFGFGKEMGFLIIFPAGSVIQVADGVGEDLVPAVGLIGATGDRGYFGLPAVGIVEGTREGRESAIPAVLIGNLALDGVLE
jgi:hypothetical protein